MIEMKYDVSFSNDTIFLTTRFFDNDVSVPFNDPRVNPILEILQNECHFGCPNRSGYQKTAIVAMNETAALLTCFATLEAMGYVDARHLQNALIDKENYSGLDIYCGIGAVPAPRCRF